MLPETVYLVLKTLLVCLSTLIASFSPVVGGGDFEPSQPVPPGDPAKYIQAEAVDAGFDMCTPSEHAGGYRYGPSMILNTDGSLDVWCATDGPTQMPPPSRISLCRSKRGR